MKKKYLFLVLFLISCFYIFPQESIPESIPENSIFFINSFSFNIEGYTRPFALINKIDLKTGEEFTGLNEFLNYIQEKTQILYNQRVLDSVSIDYKISEIPENGKYPVDLTINVKDTWNIVALPRPKYSTSSGFELILKARDYNFLGTMSALRLDLGYIYDEDERHSVVISFDSNTPFRAYGLNWYLRFRNSFDYRHETEVPFYFRNTTGLAVELPVKSTTITLGLEESFFLNEENSKFQKPVYGEFQEGLYLSSNLYFSWEIPTGLQIGKWGDLVYTPGLSAVFNHELPEWYLHEIRIGPYMIFKHNLGFDRIDWIGNFKRGFDVNVNNSFTYNFYKALNDDNPITGRLTFSGTGHFTITDFFGISCNLRYRQWFYHEAGSITVGDILRGILDNDIYADYILSLNLDFPFRILKFTPSSWFNNQNLRLFNFELHLSPFFDMALYHDPVYNLNFSFENTLVTGGLELFIFPEFFRSLYLRISYGVSLSDLALYNEYKNEIYIGTDYHY